MVIHLHYKNILFCTDYSKDAEAAFIHAFDQASKYEAKLHILGVIPSINPCGEQISQNHLSRIESSQPSETTDEHYRLQEIGALKKVYFKRCKNVIAHKFVVKIGSPDVEIINYSAENDIDLIILGTAGRQESKRRTYVRTAANVSKYADSQVITIGSPKNYK